MLSGGVARGYLPEIQRARSDGDLLHRYRSAISRSRDRSTDCGYESEAGARIAREEAEADLHRQRDRQRACVAGCGLRRCRVHHQPANHGEAGVRDSLRGALRGFRTRWKKNVGQDRPGA